TSLLWAASLIMDGQRYAKAVGVYERLLKEFPRPEINGKLLGKKAQEESALHDQYDLAKMNLARAYLIAGKATEAAKLFTELKALVVLKKKNTLIARGQFVKEARETLRDDKGRPVRCRVYYIKEGDAEVTYFSPPRQSPSQVLKGKDASQSFAKRDLMTFRQRFKTNFIVLEGLADSVWGVYKTTGDKNYLVNEVQDAWNRFYLFMSRAVDEDRYKDMVNNYNLEETKYYEKLMTVALRILDIKWERGEFGDIVRDVKSFEDNELIKEGTISDELRNKILALQKRAEAKK
ncbi:MAG: hypothetical protein P1V97_39125, partial [Planctomycetota bacterium]|nr:hypothetical protein [Planctomycetota bacterium]